MGNIGRPSSGCSRCRKRRVKCDERKPGCLRCERISEQCPGYSQDAWVFRDENDTARRRALRLKRSKGDTSSSNADSSDEHASRELVHQDQRPGPSARRLSLDNIDDDPIEECKALTKMHPTLQADLDMRSVCLFMETFTLDSSTEGNDPAFLDYLPQLYLNSAADSSVRRAVHAVSQSCFVNRYGAHDLLPQTFQSYGKALSAINKSLTRTSEALTDDTLAAVTLLSLYELICRPPFQTKVGTGWLNHIEGIQQLTRMRGDTQFTSTVGRQLFRMNYGPVFVKHIMLYEEVPEHFAALGPMISKMETDKLAASILASNFFYDAAHIRSNLQKLVLRKIGNCEDFATQLQNLIDTLQSMLRLNVFETQAIQDAHWSPRRRPVHVEGATDRIWFSSRYVASYWLQYWGTKLSLQTTVINSLLAKPGVSTIDFLNEISSLRQRVEETADDIIGSVDFAVGRIDYEGQHIKAFTPDGHPRCFSGISALHLFWPAGVVKHAAYTSTRQKEAASDALRRIGTDCLVAQALVHV